MGPLAVLLIAASPALPSGAEGRELFCAAGSSYVAVLVTRYVQEGAEERIELLRGGLSASGVAQPKDNASGKRSKPKPGCPFAFPPPAADWQLKPLRTWVRGADGHFHSGALRATWKCESRVVSAMEGPKAFLVKPGVACAASGDAFALVGGTRAELEVVSCTLAWEERGDTTRARLVWAPDVTVERVSGETDCYWGADHRVIRPP